MVLPVALRIRAILARIAWQRRAGDGVTPLACIAIVCFIRAAPAHIGGVRQDLLAGASALHSHGVEQSIDASHHFHGIIWCEIVEQDVLTMYRRILRP